MLQSAGSFAAAFRRSARAAPSRCCRHSASPRSCQGRADHGAQRVAVRAWAIAAGRLPLFARGDRTVAAKADEGERSDDEDEPEDRQAPLQPRLVPRPRGREQRDAAEERGERHGRHLPVPVHTGVDEEGDVGAGSGGSQRTAPRLYGGS